MKALAKEPVARYQTCREMLEDLRNYRSLAVADSPAATVVLNGSPEATATTPIYRMPRAEELQAAHTAQSLQSRATSPTQTPAIRRTAALPRPQPQRKSSPILTVFLALILIGVIIYGYKKIKPVFDDARQQNQIQGNGTAEKDSGKTDEPDGTATESSSTLPEAAEKNSSPTASPATPIEKKPEFAPTKAPSGSANGLSAAAAEYKGRIEEAAAEKGIANKLKIHGTGNTLTLSGKLRPVEHGELLKLLKAAPAGVQVVDDIQYDDTAVGGSAETNAHPVPASGRGAIHVITNVIGGTATASGAYGYSEHCETPCSFSNLMPGDYNLEVKKNGFQPTQTAVQIRAGQTLDEKIVLEAMAFGLHIVSHPEGADVFINGDKQSGQTPLTIPLAPNTYNLVMRLQGYEPYTQTVTVKENVQTKLDIELKARGAHVAWAQVNSNPEGAEIWVDGVPTGKQSPARVEITAGIHTIVLKKGGYQNSRRSVELTEGSTVNVRESMHSN